MDCADAFIASWVARFGVPDVITSDRGAQFTSSLWSLLCSKLGIEHRLTNAYHPQCNGMVERAPRQLKDVIRSRLARVQWPAHLPWDILGLRAAPKEDSGVSSAEMAFGAPLTLPWQFLSSPEPPPVAFVERLRQAALPPQPRPLSYAAVAAAPSAALMAVKFVYICRGGTVPPLEPLYLGPTGIVEWAQILPICSRLQARGSFCGLPEATPGVSRCVRRRPHRRPGIGRP
jgi:hypothetical protein